MPGGEKLVSPSILVYILNKMFWLPNGKEKKIGELSSKRFIIFYY